METIEWLGNSKKVVSAFDKKTKQLIGYVLMRLQVGFEPIDWKPMQSIGKGVREIRVVHTKKEYRVIYVARIRNTIHVLHVFEKKTEKTAKLDIDLVKNRYRALHQRLRGEK
jgi:phage-related protein